MRTDQAGGCLVIMVWLASVLASLGVSVALIYAAFHFARKFW